MTAVAEKSPPTAPERSIAPAEVPACAPPAKLAVGADHWRRLWRRQPDETRDDAALAREAASRRWSAVLARLDETFGDVAGLRCIELGAGRGDASALLARRGARVTLLDYCETALELARRRFRRLGLEAEFVLADLSGDLGRATSVRECPHEGTKGSTGSGIGDRESKPNPQSAIRNPQSPALGVFDLSISYGVVEHFKGAGRTRAVAAHRRVLGDHGLAVISVPHAACPTYRLWKTCLELRGWWPYGMEIPYSRRELTRRLRSAGFARVETRAFGWRDSVAEHLRHGLLRRPATHPDPRPSLLDHPLGPALVAFAWTV